MTYEQIKETFIRTVNLILLLFFSAWKANKEKRKKRQGKVLK